MNEACKHAEDLLNALFRGFKFDLQATNATTLEQGCLLNLDGHDAGLLRSEGGELLDAFEYLISQAFARQLALGERIVCDVQGFRATREAELRAMARLAAERVRASTAPFIFGPMTSNERRIIHLALAGEDDLHSESVGEGNARRLKVSLIKQ